MRLLFKLPEQFCGQGSGYGSNNSIEFIFQFEFFIGCRVAIGWSGNTEKRYPSVSVLKKRRSKYPGGR